MGAMRHAKNPGRTLFLSLITSKLVAAGSGTLGRPFFPAFTMGLLATVLVMAHLPRVRISMSILPR